MGHSETDILQARIASGESDVSLERCFYASHRVYQRDLEKVWGENWIWAGHASQIPTAGDYFLFEFGSESVILVRGAQGEIHAHLNVCLHRGSRVCLEKSGNARSFTCPYHAWTYGIDGALRSRREMPAGFDRENYGLRPVRLINFQGLLFICLSDDPPELEPALARLAPFTSPFELENLRIAHAASYPVPANWKLALENYLECYHCAPAHQAYSKSHSLKDPASMTPELINELKQRSQSIGLSIEALETTGDKADNLGADAYYRRYPLYPGYDTGSEDGRGVAPLLGSLTGYDGGASDLMIGSLNNFLIYADHMVAYRFLPVGVQDTEIQTLWLVRGDAEEGRDYDLERLTWLWHVTTLDDERIIRHNQEGVNSFHYRPGPLSEMEWGISEFYASYLRMIA